MPNVLLKMREYPSIQIVQGRPGKFDLHSVLDLWAKIIMVLLPLIKSK